MKIKGLQKLTLLDYPGKTACTVFLAGCNYRCPFCHNAGLVVEFDQEEISYETLFAFLEKRKNVLEGVCITGGEPTLNNDLPQLLAKIKEIGYSVKLDTNGTNPQMVKQLVEQGLVDYVAMDAKNGLESYPQTVGVKQLDVLPIMQTATYLMQNHVDYEFRTTVVDNFHTHESIESMGKWLKGAKVLYLQQFVDNGTLICPDLSPAPLPKMKEYKEILSKYVNEVHLRGVDE